LTLNLLAPALDELFHLTPSFGDMPFQQLACLLGVPLAAQFHDRPMFVFGVAVGVARKEYVQTDVTIHRANLPYSGDERASGHGSVVE
jgi:hypothetical protein